MPQNEDHSRGFGPKQVPMCEALNLKKGSYIA